MSDINIPTYNPTATPINQLTPEQLNSAKGVIAGYLGNFGLDGLADTAWQEYLKGIPVDEIMLNIRTSPQYQARFPAMKTLAGKGRAISEQSYIQWEQTAVNSLHAAGITDPNFYSTDYLSQYIGGEVSASEFANKVDLASKAAQQPSEYRQQLENLYGPIPGGSMAAFFLDPNTSLPKVQKEFQAAQYAKEASQAGYGQLNKDQAESLDTGNVSDAQAVAGFTALGNQKELMNALPGENADSISQDEQLAAQFQGNVYAQQRIANRAKSRASQFGGQANYTPGGIGVAKG